MSEKIANPGALGLGGFALTTFLLSFINAGILDPTSLGVVLSMAFFYGGLAQILAGMWEFKMGNIFGATCFTSYGAFWMGLALLKVLEATGVIAAVPPAGLACFLAAWGLFSLYATFAAAKAAKGLFILFIALTITFVLLVAGEFSTGFKLAGGYLGIIVALIAWYVSAAILINDMYGRKVLPI
jgi:succinate-acetate transporter protein